MLIPKIQINDTDDSLSIAESLQKLPENKISMLNWATQYPYKPDVFFKIAHNGTHLFLQYFVTEQEVLATVASDNGKVSKDSCVEFFVSFGDSPYYYNAEFSCIGKVLLGCRKERKDVVYADSAVMSSIRRYPSLGDDIFEAKKGNCEWNLLLVIPVSAFWMTTLTSFDGVEARANFYKCGDNLAVPHYVSWNPINWDKPSFHMPGFFGKLKFE